MSDIIAGILNIIKSAFIVLFRSIIKLYSPSKKDSGAHHDPKHH